MGGKGVGYIDRGFKKKLDGHRAEFPTNDLAELDLAQPRTRDSKVPPYLTYLQ